MKNIKICYIGGGSKAWAQKYFCDFVLQDKISGEIRLYDIDTKAAELNKKYFDKMVRNNPKRIKSQWTCVVESDFDKALTGVDFVLISILPYSLENMGKDIHYPEKYGIYQSVGDTVGPGGYSRALRTMTYYQEFAEKIKQNCPDAWVINYTNPMSMCVNALFKGFPEIKAFGCCHEVFGTQKHILQVMDAFDKLDEKGKADFMASDLKATKANFKKIGINFDNLQKVAHTDRHEIYTNVQGVNHFTTVNKMSYNDKDLFPMYQAYIKMFRENNAKRMKSPFTSNHQKFVYNSGNVRFNYFERFGTLGAAGDRHLAEFLPESYLPLGQKEIRKFGFRLTTIQDRYLMNWWRKFLIKFFAYTPFKTPITPSGEEGVLQIIALCGLGDLRTNVNLPNAGQAPDLPLGTAVETNAMFTINEVKPENSGNVENDELRKRYILHAENQRDYIDAFYAKDKEKLRKIFMRDPSVARLSEDKASMLFDEMIAVNFDVLPEWLKK